MAPSNGTGHFSEADRVGRWVLSDQYPRADTFASLQNAVRAMRSFQASIMVILIAGCHVVTEVPNEPANAVVSKKACRSLLDTLVSDMVDFMQHEPYERYVFQRQFDIHFKYVMNRSCWEKMRKEDFPSMNAPKADYGSVLVYCLEEPCDSLNLGHKKIVFWFDPDGSWSRYEFRWRVGHFTGQRKSRVHEY